MATSTIKSLFTNPSTERGSGSGSILTYAASLPQQGSFCVVNCSKSVLDNPVSNAGGYAIIFKTSWGQIKVIWIVTSSNSMYENHTDNNGSTWSGWSQVNQ